MLWVVIIASVLGFLAVEPLANSSDFSHFFAQVMADNRSDFAQALNLIAYASGFFSLTIIGCVCGSFWGLVWFGKTKPHHRPNRPIGVSGLSAMVMLFFSTVLSSCAAGLLDFYHYQQTLLKQPLTLEATVTTTQLSDSVNISLDNSAVDNREKSQHKLISYGSLYPRQIWQLSESHLTEFDDNQTTLQLPLTVMVTANLAKNPDWQSIVSQLKPNQSLKVKLALQPINQPKINNLPANAQPLNIGFDQAQWLRQRGVQATGEIIEIHKNSLSDVKASNQKASNQTGRWQPLRISIEAWRWQFRQKIIDHFTQSVDQPLAKHSHLSVEQILASADSHAILLGLLTGDKALMDSSLKHLYQVTGISHLLAISGPHVTMLASIMAMLVLAVVKAVFPTLLLRLPSQLLVLWISVAVAGVYALLVGFELPAQRTFYMLLMVTIATQLLIGLNTYRLLALVGLIMMWLDTTAVLQAGFWLSFVAVGLLLKFSQTNFGTVSHFSLSHLTSQDDDKSKVGLIFHHIFQQSWALLKLQLWLFVLMTPIVVWFFGKVSLISILVNLVAVPLLGLVVVPLDMLAGLLSQLPMLSIVADGLWSLLSQILMWFHQFLQLMVTHGMAKQAFMSLSHSQLILISLIVFLIGFRQILPTIAVLPLLLAVLGVSWTQHQATEQIPILAVMNHTKVTMALLKKGDETWLILADNQHLTADTRKNFAKPQKTLTAINPNSHTDTLQEEILSLLAYFQVDNLTGVISQTPSLTINQSVQSLAKALPIQQYWLAGFDPLTVKGDDWQFDAVTPKACQFNQTWHSDDKKLFINAISGWQLNLPKEQLSDEENVASQTCHLQVTTTTQQTPYQVVITAGRSNLPLAMSMQMCQISPADLLINPYQTPLDKDWLTQARPTILHILTGNYREQTLSDSSQFALADSQLDNAQRLLSHQTGSISYQLTK